MDLLLSIKIYNYLLFDEMINQILIYNNLYLDKKSYFYLVKHIILNHKDKFVIIKKEEGMMFDKLIIYFKYYHHHFDFELHYDFPNYDFYSNLILCRNPLKTVNNLEKKNKIKEININFNKIDKLLKNILKFEIGIYGIDYFNLYNNLFIKNQDIIYLYVIYLTFKTNTNILDK